MRNSIRPSSDRHYLHERKLLLLLRHAVVCVRSFYMRYFIISIFGLSLSLLFSFLLWISKFMFWFLCESLKWVPDPICLEFLINYRNRFVCVCFKRKARCARTSTTPTTGTTFSAFKIHGMNCFCTERKRPIKNFLFSSIKSTLSSVRTIRKTNRRLWNDWTW